MVDGIETDKGIRGVQGPFIYTWYNITEPDYVDTDGVGHYNPIRMSFEQVQDYRSLKHHFYLLNEVLTPGTPKFEGVQKAYNLIKERLRSFGINAVGFYTTYNPSRDV